MRPAQSLELPGLTLLRPVGSGSFGEVWLARSVTGQFRAVKIVWLLRPEDDVSNPALEDLGDRVFRGVQQYLDRIPPGSPAGLAVLHVDRDPAGRFFYYVMELADDAVTGREIRPDSYIPLTLSELRRRAEGGCLSAAETLRVGIRLAEGLEMLHRAGLVHRDLKPSNIVFVGGEARIADIDLVRPNEASMSLAGTVGYAPPEGPGRPAGDVYSLARTLYVAVTGLAVGEFPRLPEDWDQRPDADELRRLNAILLRACERDPILRPADGAAIRAELLRVAAGEDPERSRRLKRWARLASWTAGIAVPTALIAILLARQYQSQVMEKEAALREKTFALYRAYLTDAASNLARDQLGNADQALKKARSANPTGGGLELALLERQTESDSAVRISISGASVDQLAFSPDGTLLAVATGDAEVRLFRSADGKLLGVATNVAELAGFTSSGDRFIATRYVADQPTNRPLAAWSTATATLQPGEIPGRWLTISVDPASDTVFALNYENPERLLRWNLRNASAPDSIHWHAGLPRDRGPRLPEIYARLTRDGARLLYRHSVGLENDYTSLLFLTTLSNLTTTQITVPTRKINSIAISPDGSRAAYGEMNLGTVSLFRTIQGFEPLATMRDAQTTAMSFSPDGRLLATGTVDQRVQLRNPNTLNVEQTLFGNRNQITALAWTLNGDRLASGDADGEIRIWDIRHPPAHSTPDVLHGFKSGTGPGQLIASPDETWIAASSSTHSVTLVRTEDFTRGKTVDGIHMPLVFDAQGRGLWGLDPHGALVRKDITTGAETQRLKGLASTIGTTAGQASKDRSRLLLYTQERVSIWKTALEGYEELAIAECPSRQPIIDVAISEDSRWGITVGWESSATLWNLESGDAIPVRVGSGRRAFAAACFIPGTDAFLIAREDGTLIRSGIRTPNAHVDLPGNLDSPVQMLAVPDGSRLLVAGERGRLGIVRPSDGQNLVWFTHRQLNAEPGEHPLTRLLHISGQHPLYGLTEDGLLVRW